jgi:hypothetical protein
VRENPPLCLLYADDIVFIAQSRKEYERKLEKWRYALQSRGMRISRLKTEYFTTAESGDKLDNVNIKRTRTFKYLGSVVEEQTGLENEVNFRIQCGWNNWKREQERCVT